KKIEMDMDEEERIGRLVVDTAVRIHRDLGPGLLEVVYEVVMCSELRRSGLRVDRQVSFPIEYQGIRFVEGFRVDLMIDKKVVIELKSVETLSEAAKKQLLTYLRLSHRRLGYLLNFGAPLMKSGIVRIINRA